MNIPMEVRQVISNNKKNVLIISMSTLRKNSETNYYYVKHEGEEISDFYCGKYSMEPGTKHVLNKLAKGGRKLDKIILLSTPESKNIAHDNGSENAVEYYINEIRRFIKQGDILEETEKVPRFSENDSKVIRNFITKIDNITYSDDELNNLFVEIPLSDMRVLSYEAIPNIVEEVLKISGQQGANLFLDMQGGSRVSTFIINAAVNMLQDENIKLERSYATLFNRDNKVHQLRDESLSNHIFDMVSGMDEFLNYGRAKKFKEYFNYYKENYKKGDVLAEEAIVQSIEEISDAISICNIDGFYKGLDHLEEHIIAYKGLKSENKDSIFQAFVDKLEKTYEGILAEDRRAVDVMEWCLKKEWYQQALTVCESKMPKQMVEEKVVYYCKNSNEKQSVIDRLNANYNKNKYMCRGVKDAYLFVIKYYEYRNGRDNLTELIENGLLYSDYYSGSLKAKVKEITDRYFELANIRNKVNHGAAGSVDLEKLKIDMSKFINLYREVVQDNWKNNRISADCIITMNQIKKGK